MINLIKNKRGQIIDNPIITFVVLVFGFLLVGIIILFVMMTIQPAMSSGLGNVSNGGNIAQANFNHIMLITIGFWDKIIILLFIVSLILLLVSAFLIDAHPIFVIIYIIMAFLIVITAPNMMTAVDAIYNNPVFAAESNMLPFLNFIRLNFGYILVGIIVFTGIIIYGKVFLKSKFNRR